MVAIMDSRMNLDLLLILCFLQYSSMTLFSRLLKRME